MEWNEHQWGPAARILRKLGARGWVAPTWPKKWGGLEASNVGRLIIAEELSYHGVHAGLGGGMAGPTIIHFGIEEQKEEWLPPITRDEIEFALGYTEPAGSDVAALDIRAVEGTKHREFTHRHNYT